MHDARTTTREFARRRWLAALAVAAAVGCEREGPAIEARPQSITFASAPAPGVGQASATVSATATSGLPVRYSSTTPSPCSVGAGSGVVAATASGTCTIAANQPGDSRYAPAPQVSQDVTFELGDRLAFTPAPTLSVYDQATVTATASTGLPVGYASSTPSVCSVDGTTGLVIALSTGDCTIVASAGTLQATQTITVSAPTGLSVPGTPSGVVASAGETPGTVAVRIGAVQAGGSPITGYSVSSSPPGVAGVGTASPIIVPCPSSCAGYRLSVAATNALGTSLPSEPAEIVTRYDVTATFHEPDTQPNDSIFVGGLTFDATTGTASDLRGELSEAMTGGATPYPDDTMTWLSLDHQLSSVPITLDGVDGLLVTTFLLGTTSTLSDDPAFGGTDGWSPGSGMGLHFGYPGENPGNAYVRVFVDTANPTAVPTRAQLDALAYADCSPGGMMGATCMTGTAEAGYGAIGTMGGQPVSQTTTRR